MFVCACACMYVCVCVCMCTGYMALSCHPVSATLGSRPFTTALPPFFSFSLLQEVKSLTKDELRKVCYLSGFFTTACDCTARGRITWNGGHLATNISLCYTFLDEKCYSFSLENGIGWLNWSISEVVRAYNLEPLKSSTKISKYIFAKCFFGILFVCCRGASSYRLVLGGTWENCGSSHHLRGCYCQDKARGMFYVILSWKPFQCRGTIFKNKQSFPSVQSYVMLQPTSVCVYCLLVRLDCRVTQERYSQIRTIIPLTYILYHEDLYCPKMLTGETHSVCSM